MAKRLGKRERAAMAAKAQHRRDVTACNLRVQPVNDTPSMRETIAYRPPIERLSQYARGRVMHNTKGISMTKGAQAKLTPPRWKG